MLFNGQRKFPMTFHPITVDDYESLKRFFVKQAYRLSIYSLFSIIVWSNQKLRTWFAVENDTLMLYNESDSGSDRQLLLPLSLTEVITPEYLHNLAIKMGIDQYCFVPETTLQQFDQRTLASYFTLTEQPEFEDYIYLTEDLARLKGNRYAKQRNLIHQFDKVYLQNERAGVETIHPDNVGDCLEFLQKWCDERDCDAASDDSLACEKMATINALKNLDRLELQGILIRIDGEASAFGICSHLTEDMGILNFEKAFSQIKGLYQFLDNECAKRLFNRYRYINKESDMNLPNLAHSKNSYHPVMKLKSYCLAAR
jgi:hypothetical protein